jgi:hypothetical protein
MLMGALLALLPGVASGAEAPTLKLAQESPTNGHDNTTASRHDRQWTHGDPNAGIFGNSMPSSNYYYLDITMAGKYAWCEVYTPGDWKIDILPADSVSNIPFITGHFHGTGGRVFYHGFTGKPVRCRVSNISPYGFIQKDYAELNSGNPGDLNSDCGGPGPVVDPNTNSEPVEPPESINVGPAVPNQCQHPTTIRGAAAPAPCSATTYFGDATSGAYELSVLTRGDLTVISLHGSHGTPATMSVTDTTGHVINNPRWGSNPDPNPATTTSGFTAVDAGVVSPGAYFIYYSGPPGDLGALVDYVTNGSFALVPVPTQAPAQTATAPACSRKTAVVNGSVGSQSVVTFFKAPGTSLWAILAWTGPARLGLIVYADGSGTSVLSRNLSGISPESIMVPVPPGSQHELKVLSEGGTAQFVLAVTS